MFLNLLYDFFKVLILTVIRIFYPYTAVINKKEFKFDNPTIVVSNHPNTLLDAVGVAARVKKRVFFLANASLFSNPVANWVLNKLYCIPIMRKKDASKKQVDNNNSFQRSYEHFEKGGSMYIAPEGTSFMEHRLRTLKSGTARIALGAEAANDWTLGLTILPVGLTYANAHKFGSRLVVNVGAPISIKDFKADYEKDSFKTSSNLTALLQNRMQSLITHTIDDEEDDIVQKLELIDLSENSNLEQVFGNTQKRIPILRSLEATDFDSIKEKTLAYFNLLKSHGTNDKAVFLQKAKGLSSNPLIRILLLILGFSFFLYGAVNHLFAFGIPALVTKLAKLYIGYDSAVKTLVGMITFPLFYILQFKVVNAYFDVNIATLYILTLPILGLFAWKYASYFKLTSAIIHFLKLNKKEKSNILESREELKALTQILKVDL